MADISIIAAVQNERGEWVYACSTVRTDLNWIPMNSGDGPIAANFLPHTLVEVEIGTREGTTKWPTYRDPSLRREMTGVSTVTYMEDA